MKDNAHLYWPSAALSERPVTSSNPLPTMQSDGALARALISIERLDGGCIVYWLAPRERTCLGE